MKNVRMPKAAEAINTRTVMRYRVKSYKVNLFECSLKLVG